MQQSCFSFNYVDLLFSKSLARDARAVSCQSLPGVFMAQLDLEPNFQQFLLSGYEVPEERRKWGWDLAEPRARAWHMSSLLALGKKKTVYFCFCLCFSTGAEIQTSPSSCIHLLSTQWASLSGAMPSYPSEGSDGSSSVNGWVFHCFSHLGICRTVEPNLIRTAVTEEP